MILTGQITTARDLGYFPTPPAVAARLLDLANLEPGMVVLEPSAGTGELVRAIVARGGVVDAVELDAQRGSSLVVAGACLVYLGDFLAFHGGAGTYDRVVMNPPFARQADITHVLHALEFLRPGGRLVSVMSDGVTFRSGAAAAFRDVVAQAGGTIEELPPGSFTPSGTSVHTVIVVIPG
jgi:predicted RNA methylase